MLQGITKATGATEWVHRPGVERLDPQCAGYWRALLRPYYAREVWDRVSAAVRAGRLGPAARLRPIAKNQVVELRVHIEDVRNHEEVKRVRQILRRELGFVRPIACYAWDGRRRWYDAGAREITPRQIGGRR